LTTRVQDSFRASHDRARARNGKDPCVHTLIEAHAASSPLAVAVSCGDRHLTYRELNARANGLAERLRQQRVGPDVLVGLHADRSIEMVVGLLGILKAGGAYVPLDPDHPPAHLNSILREAKIRVIVTSPYLQAPVPRAQERPPFVVAVDADVTGEAATSLRETSGPERLAYVMPTSGSSGPPKGVMVTHRNLLYSTNARRITYPERIHGFVLLPPIGFDGSVATIFWTLCAGSRLIVPPPGSEQDPLAIGRLIARERASHLLCVPTLYSYVLDRAAVEELASLRVVVVGGEVCPPTLVARHRQKAPAARLFNEYGPTECTVWSSVSDTTSLPEGVPVPIGLSISGTQIHILDAGLQPVPTGVAGEIYIGGDGVARGYLNRPDLTADCFLPDPFSGAPGARLYKTGDLGRRRADGQLEFLGRLDQQVKIRGCRVEPEAVEATLAQHPGVRACAVTASQEREGARHLIAWVVGAAGHEASGADLGSFLRQRLPAFMVPADFVFLDTLPTTPSGKVDRRALLPLYRRDGSERPERSDLLELRLRDMWEQMLGVSPIGLADNFFALGGHSLLAVEMLTRVEALTGARLPLTSVLDAPTIRDLVRVVQQSTITPGARPPLVPVQPDGSRTPLFCVPGAGQTALLYGSLAYHLGRNQPVYAIAPDENPSGHAPEVRIEDIAVRCVAELRAQQPTGPYCLAGNSFGGLIAYEMARHLVSTGQTVALLALFDTFNPAVGVTRYRYLARGVIYRIRLHLRRLASEPDKLRYLAARFRSVANILKLLVSQFARRLGNTRGFGWLEGQYDANIRHANGLAYLHYVPGEYPGRLTLFRARQRRALTASDRLLGWGGCAKEVDVHEVAGDHWTMFQEPHVRVLAERLRDCLEKIGDVTPGVSQASRPTG
jgi:amino acid adenylation domain-containing protein